MQITNKIIEDSIQAPLGSAFLKEDTQIISAPNWYQIITPSMKSEFMNEVIISRMTLSELDQKIHEVFATYAKHSLPFKWVTGPMSAPDELRERIAPYAETSWGFRGMATALDLKLSVPDNAVTERMTERNFEEFFDVFLEGWGLNHLRDSYRNELQKSLLPTSNKAYYLTRYKSKPAGVSGTVFKSNYGYLTSSVILPEFRGRGLYKSLVQERLNDLKTKRFTHAVTQAREATSAPMLEKLGFVTTFKGLIYKFAPGTEFK